MSERGDVRVPDGPTIEWDVVPEGQGWLYSVWVDCAGGMIAEGYRSRRRDALRVAKKIAAQSAEECEAR